MKFAEQASCKRCQPDMEHVATILGGNPGLVAFLCAECGKSNSILVYPINMQVEPRTAQVR
jgi:uncharacterized Zn finger protein